MLPTFVDNAVQRTRISIITWKMQVERSTAASAHRAVNAVNIKNTDRSMMKPAHNLQQNNHQQLTRSCAMYTHSYVQKYVCVQRIHIKTKTARFATTAVEMPCAASAAPAPRHSLWTSTRARQARASLARPHHCANRLPTLPV